MYGPPPINIQKSSAEPHEKEDDEKEEEKDKEEDEEENEEEDEKENASCDKSHDQETLCSESDYEDSRAILEFRKKRQYKKRYPHISPLKPQGGLQGIPKKVAATTDLKSILLSRRHDMVITKKRKACFGCKI
jgi:hypothetical protein